jgi:hypothetical protein
MNTAVEDTDLQRREAGLKQELRLVQERRAQLRGQRLYSPLERIAAAVGCANVSMLVLLFNLAIGERYKAPKTAKNPTLAGKSSPLPLAILN